MESLKFLCLVWVFLPSLQEVAFSYNPYTKLVYTTVKASEKEAVIKFHSPVSSTTFTGKKIYLIRDKMELMKHKKKMETKLVSSLQVGDIFYSPNYEDEAIEYSTIFSGISPGIGVILKAGFNHFNYKELKKIQVSSENYTEYSAVRNTDTFYLSLLGGFDTESGAIEFGPILGVQNEENQIGWDVLLHFGKVDSSQFLLDGYVIGDLWEFYGCSRVRVLSHNRFAFQLKFTSYPDYENGPNSSLMVGYTTIDAPVQIEALIGLGIGGGARRGLTTYFRVGKVFKQP